LQESGMARIVWSRSAPIVTPPQPEPDAAVEELVFACLQADDAERDRLLAAQPELAARARAVLATLRSEDLLAEPQGAAPDRVPEQLGQFRLLRRLGAGGMGIVYLAEELGLGRRVALKLVRPELLYFPGSRERFRREVEAVARLSHGGIVPVHAVGEEAGIPYFTMEYIDGRSLAEVLDAVRGRDPATLRARDLWLPRETDGAQTPSAPAFAGTWTDACLRLVEQVAEALQHAHDRGVVHRDVKPSNILLSGDGRARLLDFGLSLTEGASQLTRTGSEIGSLPYMPPERLDDRGADAGARGDIYALGVTLYELLTLRCPFLRESAEGTRRAVLDGRAPLPRAHNRSASWEAEVVCLTAMERDPKRRYRTAQDFARDLAAARQRRPIEARRPGLGLRAVRTVQRHPTASVAIALGSLLAVGVPLVYALQERAGRRTAEQLQALAEERGYAASLLAAEHNLALREPQEARQSLRETPPAQRGFEWRHLMLKADTSVRVLVGHEGAVTAAALAPDGSWIASGGADGTVRLWPWDGGAARSIAAHPGGVTDVEFAADGASVYSAGSDGVVLACSVADQSVRPIGKHEAAVLQLALAPDGGRLAAVDRQNHIKIWSVRDGALLQELEPATAWRRSLAWHPDGKELFAGDLVGGIDAFDAETGARTRQLDAHIGGIERLAIDAEGKQLLSAAGDSTARLWDLEHNTVLRPYAGYRQAVTAVAFAADGASFYSAGGDANLALRRMSGYSVALHNGHEDAITDLAVHVDGVHVVTASADGTLRIWQPERHASTSVLEKHTGAVRAVAVAAAGDRVVSGGSDGRLCVWDTARCALAWEDIAADRRVRSLALGGGDRDLLVGRQDRRIERWDLHERRRRALLDGADGEVVGVAWAGGERFVSADSSGLLRLCAADDGTAVWSTATGGEISALAVHVGSRRCATAHANGTVNLWSLDDGAHLRELGRHEKDAAAVAFRGDGRRLASAGHDGKVVIYDAESGTRLRELPWQGRLLSCLAWSGDGRRLAAGVMDRQIRLWNADNGRVVMTVGGHYRAVFGVAFAADDRFLVSCSWDRTVWLLHTPESRPAIR
jgi:WD40 repeat protein/serine/threonine protein kinase